MPSVSDYGRDGCAGRCPTVVPDVQRWRDPDKDPPKVEEEVLILFETACGGYGITTAHYEDGTLLSQDSIFTGMNLQHGASWMKNMMITSSPKGGGNIATSIRTKSTTTG